MDSLPTLLFGCLAPDPEDSVPDDGLTVGQEERDVTETMTVTLSELEFNTETLPNENETIPKRTNPMTPDTDSDGVWDGWVGVHGVGHSENVVLYMEHLESDDGLVGDELVPEQAGIHRVTPRAPARTAAVIDGERVHSNIHVGERHWETNPNDDAHWPDRSLSVELDYYAEAPGLDALNSDRWTDGVERNFRLYGLDVQLHRDEVLTREDLVTCSERGLLGADDPALGCVDATQLHTGFSRAELRVVRYHNQSQDTEEYVLVAHELDLSFETLGANLGTAPIVALSMRDVEETASRQNAGRHVEQSPYATDVGLVAAGVQLHEHGHSVHVGERDDAVHLLFGRRINETHSGSQADDTPESLRTGLDEWSIMRSGWDDELVRPPMAGRYYAFSVEELSTLEKP